MLNFLDWIWDRVSDPGWYDREYVSSSSPIIIGGCARSGTTLMRVILDTHPNIYCGPESNLFTAVRIRTSKRIKELSWIFDVPAPEIKRQISSCRCKSEFIEKFFNTLILEHGKRRWGDKSPRNVLNLKYIFKHFPDARFIHMIRDGRDVSCSLRHFPKRKIVNGKIVPLNTNNSIEKCINRWVNDVNEGRMWKGDPRYHEVRYEDLVFNTEETLREVFDFLGETYDQIVLRYYEVENSTRNTSKFPQNIEATQPIYTQSIGRWKKEFTEQDKELFKHLAGGLLIELGYVDDQYW